VGEVQLTGPDLSQGVPLSGLPDGGMLAGHANGKPVLLARRGGELFAVDGACTHYSGPLAEGLMVGETVRCPWHHACFDLRTGAALKAPALRPLAVWNVEQRDGLAIVTGPAAGSSQLAGSGQAASRKPHAVVIVGAGAAADAAADMLRRHGYDGPITMIGAEDSPPVDRPNLSKDYLAGNAPEEWIPLRSPEYFAEQKITLVAGLRVARVDVRSKRVVCDDGSEYAFESLLIATGASPVKLPAKIDVAGRVKYLRSLSDCREIIAAAERATTAVVIGASFIGLEVAASLRARKIAVHVVAPELLPLERILGRELGEFVRRQHEANGVTFHLGRTAGSVGPKTVTLDDGSAIDADLVVAGIGVRPNTELAMLAKLDVENGIQVDALLETSVPGIFAAGDVARYPDPRTGGRIRVEHWVHAQRQGQAAARNILGAKERFTDVPFFWSAHYGDTIAYVGHAEQWDRVALDGRLGDKDAAVSYIAGDQTLAVATVGRDRVSLDSEVTMEATR
jgi:NADPH-dependent 2,4-dienoyl-CoA reductase/sulfur reductase-like enzyme/nitrite reductase/ring-hydroxylating ferredoxin subunit